MTAAFEQRAEFDSLYQQACIHFQCEERVSGAGKRSSKNRVKREKIHNTMARFHAAMSSPNPPATKEKAVEAIAPLISLLLSLFLKQLIVQVIEWLWDQVHEPQTVTVTAKGTL